MLCSAGLLGSADAEHGPGLGAGTRAALSRRLSWGWDRGGSDPGVPSSPHTASSSYPPSFCSRVGILG